MIAVEAAARLKQQVKDLAQVGGELDFLDAQDGLKSTPAAFVIETDEQAEVASLTGRTRHIVTLRFSVVLVVRKAGARGGKRMNEATDLRETIRDALIGWQPGGFIESVTYRGFQIRQLEAGLAAWQLNFETRRRPATT